MNRVRLIPLALLPLVSVLSAVAQPTVSEVPAPTTTQGTPGTVIVPFFPGAGSTPGTSAPRNTGPVGGGNVVNSSSRPVNGTEQDGFDFRPGQSTRTAHGGAGGPVFSEGRVRGGEVPSTHSVRRGDTLASICDRYFQNPYQWPRIWSLNPQIQNPHWIYPGDEVRLRTGGPAPTAAPGRGGLIDRRRQVPPDTVFLRDNGFIEDGSQEDWGELIGSAVDKMFLTSPDEVYLRLSPDKEPRLGQELTVFRGVRQVRTGQMVQIQGTVRVDQWNAKDHIARARVTENTDIIERGARVGQVGRRFQVVPPVRNTVDVQAEVLASVYPHNFFGQNQVLFIDKGEKDGLRAGNRLLILRKGDAWRRSLATPGAANRISPNSETLPELERTPGIKDENRFPEEVVGELRVVSVRAHTATCVVTLARYEIERGEVAVARKGY
ncbi:MAG: LysM peptidoglycan-binding domain-containing protein [Myxococcales bacterium]